MGGKQREARLWGGCVRHSDPAAERTAKHTRNVSIQRTDGGRRVQTRGALRHGKHPPRCWAMIAVPRTAAARFFASKVRCSASSTRRFSSKSANGRMVAAGACMRGQGGWEGAETREGERGGRQPLTSNAPFARDTRLPFDHKPLCTVPSAQRISPCMDQHRTTSVGAGKGQNTGWRGGVRVPRKPSGRRSAGCREQQGAGALNQSRT